MRGFQSLWVILKLIRKIETSKLDQSSGVEFASTLTEATIDLPIKATELFIFKLFFCVFNVNFQPISKKLKKL